MWSEAAEYATEKFQSVDLLEFGGLEGQRLGDVCARRAGGRPGSGFPPRLCIAATDTQPGTRTTAGRKPRTCAVEVLWCANACRRAASRGHSPPVGWTTLTSEPMYTSRAGRGERRIVSAIDYSVHYIGDAYS